MERRWNVTPILELKALDKHFGGIHVTRHMNLSVKEGELSAIIGPNGAGKTTLFNLITGFVKPDSGDIMYQGKSIYRRSPERIIRLGIVKTFQVASLFPDKTVFNNVYMATLSYFRKSWQFWKGAAPTPELLVYTEEILAAMGLTGKRNRMAFELSHGEQKVLDIALALALKPQVLLLDEPTAGMSPDERLKMRQLLKRLHEHFKVTTIFIEHDMDMVLGVAETVRVLVHGALIAEGSPEDIMKNSEVIDAYLGKEIL